MSKLWNRQIFRQVYITLFLSLNNMSSVQKYFQPFCLHSTNSTMLRLKKLSAAEKDSRPEAKIKDAAAHEPSRDDSDRGSQNWCGIGAS